MKGDNVYVEKSGAKDFEWVRLHSRDRVLKIIMATSLFHLESFQMLKYSKGNFIISKSIGLLINRSARKKNGVIT